MTRRIESIDLLRGAVMIIMALDHVRDYFHKDAFLYSPTDLNRTSVTLFFTRFITHYCAPVFVFLAGVSAFLYGARRSKKELSLFLLKRGIWLLIAEVGIITLAWTFNPAWHFIFLQIIFDFGVSMIVLSGLVYLDKRLVLLVGILLITCHNLLDPVHVPGDGPLAFVWSALHEARYFTYGYFTIRTHFPLLPWIGIMAIGYYL
ncbi:MAG TPA: heparan-alpha-glucosaminide N-acetyltransferase domain-containing protein, partial [Puia sp.]